MSSRIFALVILGLSGCVQKSGPTQEYDFVGTWDCGVGTFTFTKTTYSTGSNSYPIESVSRDGRNYILYFGNGERVALVAVTPSGMTWVSAASDDQFNCVRRK